ncbi:MAG TPA: hypothetical protein ENI51_07960 [Candidatus Atribacteria bacterium]|nr:hypothetical protein [Candidatus Atribacteria bacterium]
MTKNTKIYQDLLEYRSIQKYLEKAIGKKKSKVGQNLSFQEKIESINLVAYLRGIKVFFEYSKLFENPSDIIDFWKKNRDNENEIDKLEQEIENYPTWLMTKKGLSESTAITYQTHIRGFLTNNNIRLTFKNYEPKTIKRKLQNKLGITYDEMKSFAQKVKEFISDFDLKFLTEFMHRTGLAFREIADLTFGDLRSKNYDTDDYILLAGFREKTSVDYANFISPDFKPMVLAFLKKYSDKKDSDKLFGNDTKVAYNSLNRMFNTAYKKCAEAYFPRFLDVKTPKGNLKKLFSLHSFRAVFKSACDKVRVIPEYRDLFIAHKSDKMINYDLLPIDELIENYKSVENELFGTKKQDNDTIEQVFEILKELVMNSGKRKALFRKYNENSEIDMDLELRGAIFLESFKQQIISDIKKEISKELDEIIKEKIANLSLKDLLSSL